MTSTIELIAERLRTKTTRHRRNDGYHIALVVECGGMRAVAAGGILRSFADAGMQTVFDSAHGSSAGACAAAYFWSDQIDAGRAIYFEDISNRRVVNPYRFWSRPCMVDTDYIADAIIGKKRAINAENLLGDTASFTVVTSNAKTGDPIFLSNFKNRAEILNALRASLRVPGIRETGVKIGESMNLDGGITSPISITSAIAAGATHAVVVGTQRLGDYPTSRTDDTFEAKMLSALYGRKLKNGFDRGQELRSSIYVGNSNLPLHIEFVARASTSIYCSWHTIDKAILKEVESDATCAGKDLVSKITKSRNSI